jgi:hypothetical protein
LEAAVAKSNKGRRTDSAAEHVAEARILSTKFSYFISNHGPQQAPRRVDDKAIIHLDAEIAKIEPREPKLVGPHLECSLVCARRYSDEAQEQSNGQPMLYSIQLRRNARSLLAYLPSDAFWAVQSQLAVGTLKRIEVSYTKPTRGLSELISLHLL